MDKLPRLKDIRPFVSTRNACKLCAPLGASVALKGIEGCVPVIHGSQGCATYIRRYMISHYKEPVDIASSNFSEETTIFGGAQNLREALGNVIGQYKPKAVGVATTCLSETIGEDVFHQLAEVRKQTAGEDWPELFTVSTPSYQGTHMDGFHATVLEIVKHFVKDDEKAADRLNIFPGFVSPADIRQLKEIISDYGIKPILIPDFSDALDNPLWDKYYRVPEGGTPLDEICKAGGAVASIELGLFTKVANGGKESGLMHSAASWLESEHNVKNYKSLMPIGVNSSDDFFDNLTRVTGVEMPEKYMKQRGRLLDAYADGHKYVFGKKAVVYGEEDLVLGLCSFLDEIGVEVVIAGTGAYSGRLEEELKKACPNHGENMKVLGDSDFERISDESHKIKPDIIIGNSKGYYIARELKIPIVRVGFPIHDRVGGQRINHLGYAGTQELFDKVVNALLEYKQENSPVGFKYM